MNEICHNSALYKDVNVHITNLIEMTNKMQMSRTIYYSIVP